MAVFQCFLNVISYKIKILKKMNYKLIKNIVFSCFFLIFLNSCGKDFFKYSSSKDNPVRGLERAKKNVAEGKGVSLNKIRRSKTTYEFSTSNPLWRASLDILDFIPMSTVDYSGGTIVSDWYTDGTQNDESIKITLRFLSNEIQAGSLKVVVHKKKCSVNQNCSISLIDNSILVDELQRSILRRAALIQKEQSENKKKK